MKATQLLHHEGQSLWLDNITRDLLDSGALQHYIDDLSITGLTSNPTIFDQAIKNSATYDPAITQKMKQGVSAEALFFEIGTLGIGSHMLVSIGGGSGTPPFCSSMSCTASGATGDWLR